MKKFYFVFFTILFYSCTTTPVTGKKALILLPFSQEIQLGDEAYQDFLNKERANINTDKRINAIVQRVAMNIAKNSDMPELAWDFKVINSKEVNAFCLPGGKIVVYTGILPLCKNEAGLAAVIGHEIAHAVARHAAQRISQGLIINAGITATSLSLKDSKYKDLILASMGIGSTVGIVLSYSRQHEYEADEIGTVYMARAGYDPKEAASLWDRFSAQGGNRQPQFLSTHPYSEERAKRLRSVVIPKAMQEYERSAKHGLGNTL